ncbi:RmlC-like cupin domain-containing protein [Mycena polygramma]|nr:RmlC-like cupin domain-containing protein [Mycena polygramma]
MLSFTTVLVAALLGSTAVIAAPPPPSADSDIVGKLRLAATAVDRINLLPDDKQFTFDFFDPANKPVTGAGGHLVLANSGNFPAVIGNGVAMAVGLLEACGINTPHTHPRATEVQYSVNGTISTGLITENGGRFIMTELKPGGMTLFQKGSIHFQANTGCEPALFVSSFNAEDPGVLQAGQRFLGLSPDIVAATLGDIGVEQVEGLDEIIPDSIAQGTDECLKRCGITRVKQQTTQRQPRVSGNAFPSGVTASAWPVASKY